MTFDEYNRPQRNFLTGRFLIGHTPPNKGKKMETYLDPETMERVKRNLMLGRKKPGELAPCCGWNKRKVAFFDENGTPIVIESAEAAGRMLGAPGTNVRKVCDGKRKRVHGVRFYWWDSREWAQVYKEHMNQL